MSAGEASQGPAIPRDPRYEDRIERLDRLFYIRWTSGPDYERAFICIEDGEPDMNDIARVSFGRAATFAAAYRAAKTLPLTPEPQPEPEKHGRDDPKWGTGIG